MTRIAYVNGQYVPHDEAVVHIEDRGFQFADGVYEVIAVHQGKLIDEELHMERLERSLGELSIAWPISRRSMPVVMRQVVRRNRVHNGLLYLQVTRGVAPRNHAFPDHDHSSLVMTSRPTASFDKEAIAKGVDVITVPDIRWSRRDIKSISLLPNCLSKQQAVEAGAYEAWFIDNDGLITEGTACNAWIVTKDGELLSRKADSDILNGITRQSLIKLAEKEGVSFTERAFTPDEAKAAKEAFLTSTTSFVKPVVRIDGQSVGNGKAGSLTRRLLDFYGAHMDGQA
ncbi:MAG: D-amino-acid transaminase [Rhodospirillales bacterium]|nr:D-amino-acid transaminase [Rhodospirillales bacterium]